MARKSAKTAISPTRKLVGGTILILILALILWGALMVYSLVMSHVFDELDPKTFQANSSEEEQMLPNNAQSRIVSIKASVSELSVQFEEAYENYYTQCRTKAMLSAEANYSRVSRYGDAMIIKSGKGGIIKIENGKVVLPREMRPGIRKYAGQFTQDSGTIIYDTNTMERIRKDILAYCHIRGPYYYVEIFNGDEMLDYIQRSVNYYEILESMQAAYGVGLYLICPDRENSRYFFNLKGNLVFFPDKIEGIGDDMNAEELGMPSDYESLREYGKTIRTSDLSGDLTAPSEVYYVDKIDVLDSILLIGAPYLDVARKVTEETMFGFVVIMILSFVFIIWITSVYREMQKGAAAVEKLESYSPARMRLISASCCVLGAIIVFLSCLFIRSLSSIYVESQEMSVALSVMDWQIGRNEDYEEQRYGQRRQLYLDYAFRTAELLQNNPELREREELGQLNRIMGTEYIMLYDSQGKETASSAGYIGMELGAANVDKPLSSADFRRILNGVAGISHTAFKDEVTGRKLELYGVRMKEAETGKYGVLMLAVKPQGASDSEKTDAVDRIMNTLTPSRSYTFSMDSQKKEYVNVSSEDLYYEIYQEDMASKGNIFRDGLVDFVRFGGRKYLMVSKKAEEGKIFYYMCMPTALVYGNAFRYSFYYALGFIVIFTILCIYLLSGYNTQTLERIRNGLQEESVQNQEKATLRSRLQPVLHLVAGNSTPEKKALLVFQILIALTLLSVVMSASSRVSEGGSSVLSYIIDGKWNRGFNLFSITSIVMLLCGIELVLVFFGFVLNTVGRMLNSRGKTICKLIKNMMNYVALMIFFYYALSYLGVDTNAILASVGVIGIGVSMGARDLIADIFAGVSTIFEGEYQVGDIVNIDGYRGMVQEIGVRSTTLVGRGGNIKVIGNKDIHSVTNLTKMNSWVAVTIRVDVNYPLEDAEKVIYEALPRITAECPQIISGPYYKGVLAVEMGFAVLSIIAECNEDDYHKVERVLVRDVLLALREKNIPVR